MSRELTKAECVELYAGRCPRCAHSPLEPGPRGGAAQNVFCENCGAGFNRVAADVLERFGKDGALWAQQIREGRHK